MFNEIHIRIDILCEYLVSLLRKLSNTCMKTSCIKRLRIRV